MRHIAICEKRDKLQDVSFWVAGKGWISVPVSEDFFVNGKYETVIDGEMYLIYTKDMWNRVPVNQWSIHYVSEDSVPEIANIHTHFPRKMYHQDFQVVLKFPPMVASHILNSFGTLVTNGVIFEPDDMVQGIFADCPVCLKEYTEMGRKVLRVIIPDQNNRFPWEENCDQVYMRQMEDILL